MAWLLQSLNDTRAKQLEQSALPKNPPNSNLHGKTPTLLLRCAVVGEVRQAYLEDHFHLGKRERSASPQPWPPWVIGQSDLGKRGEPRKAHGPTYMHVTTSSVVCLKEK